MADETSRAESGQSNRKLVGLLAQFDGPAPLIEASDHARTAGYKKMDAYSPFPVHGIDDALGIRRTRLPFLVLAVALTACVGAIGLQWYCNAAPEVDGPISGYPFRISGKPAFSLPANMPVTFEIIVLSSAFATLLGMLALNHLPKLSNPLFRMESFKRVTIDSFFLMIEADDSNFDDQRTRQQLESWGATRVERCEQDLSDATMPAFFKPVAWCLISLALVPPVMILRARGATNPLPRLHAVLDMDYQHKSKTQTVSPRNDDGTLLFADGRAMRPPITGTIARGELQDDIEFYHGIKAGSQTVSMATTSTPFTRTRFDVPHLQEGAPSTAQDAQTEPEPDWVTEFPLEVNRELMERGRERYNIYCAACHGYAGDGDGLVSRRGMELNVQGRAAWIQSKSLFDPLVLRNEKTGVEQPIGRIFDTITNGRAGMAPYGDQIPPKDRWAIVLYVKALQMSRAVPEDEIPQDVLSNLPPKPEPQPNESGTPQPGNTSPQQ